MFPLKASLSVGDWVGRFFCREWFFVYASSVVAEKVMCGTFHSNTPVKDPLLKMTLFDVSTDPVGGAPATAGTASTEIASAKVASSIVIILFIVLESSPFLQARHMFETRFRRFPSK